MTALRVNALDLVERNDGTPTLVCLPVSRSPLVVMKWKIPFARQCAQPELLSEFESALGEQWRRTTRQDRSPLLDSSGVRLSCTTTRRGLVVTAKFLQIGTDAVLRTLLRVLTGELDYRAKACHRAASRGATVIEQARNAALRLMADEEHRTSESRITSVSGLHRLLDLARSSLVLAGPVRPQGVRALLDEQVFFRSADRHGNLPAGSLKPAPGVFTWSAPGESNAVVMLAAPAPARGESELAAAEVAITLFGGWHGSRLFTRLRDALGLVYGPVSRIAHLEQGALFTAAVPVRPGDALQVVQEIRTVVNNTLTRPPTPTEVAAAGRFVAGTLAISLDTVPGLASCLAAVEPEPGASFVNDHLAALHTVHPAAVADANHRLLGADMVSVVVLVPETMTGSLSRTGVRTWNA